mmetsp:Transcript_61476/g.71837  ORF Transcript_61476/g.71837 Transcript_61476/m.71837 type:complete len:254 (+) Transcript_61476:313-1074(+)
MKLNYESCVLGSKVVLVPYRPEHVDTYHGWMQDQEILDQTGSEPLSLQQEIDMQLEWYNDEMKCTFIVLSRDLCNFGDNCDDALVDRTPTNENPLFVERNLDAMIGDINLFLSTWDKDENEDETAANNPKNKDIDQISKNVNHEIMQAEIDIMIAEHSNRRCGMGLQACRMMIAYGHDHLGVQRFFARINEDNTASISMFRNKLGFSQCGYAECFKQVELELLCTSDTLDRIRGQILPLLDTNQLQIFESKVP